MSGELRQYGPHREGASAAKPGRSPYTAAGPRLDLGRPYAGESYYSVPPIKAGHYRWLITAYFFIGGLGSAAQFIATIANLVGGRRDRGIVRGGRYLALLGALASPALLIADLQAPRRWFNMLRIYRGTSAMSIGSWALSLFGAFSGLTAVGQAAEDLGLPAGRALGRLAQLPAAAAGGIVALYTGTLLAATNLPFVAAAFPFLSSLFASSAASTAAAALSLLAEGGGTPPESRRRLNLFAIAAGISELIFALLVHAGWRRHETTASLAQPHLANSYRLGVLGLGIGAPLVVHLAEATGARHSRPATVLASLSALAGGFILRAVFVFGGNESERHPEEYFRMTQPSAGANGGGKGDGSR